jgi:ParB-like chromosome segregation protein Spo0J
VELVPRTTAPLQPTGVVELVPLGAIIGDPTFRLRPEGDVAALAGSIARLGQLTPIELRPIPSPEGSPRRFQVVAGFRRLAAVALLARDRVLARVHARLDEDDAWGLALTQALLDQPLGAPELAALKERLASLAGAGWAEALVDEALERAAAGEGAPAGAPPGGEEASDDAQDAAGDAAMEEAPVEVTPEELAEGLATRLWEINSDLSVATDAWDDLPAHGRRIILEQLRFVAELHDYLAGGRR